MRRLVGKICILATMNSLFFVGISSLAAVPGNVDMNKIKTTRISRTNTERKTLGLKAYTGNILLDTSAQKRAGYLQALGKTTHKRLTTDGYYNYTSIRDRFAVQHIDFRNEVGTVFSESLGWGYYNCAKSDCTDALIKATKSTWGFFMNEKYKKSRPHYNAIVSKTFNNIGLGIAVSKNRYYLVAHYGKDVVKMETWKDGNMERGN